MNSSLPPIVRQAERLLVEIERAVRAFGRYVKYTVGTDLRRMAMEVATLAHRAWDERKRAAQWTQQLVWSIDKLKVCLQLGKRLEAFSSFAQFEMLAGLTSDLGRQAGGWNRQQIKLHPKGQNPACCCAQERAQILSTHAASSEVKL